MAKTWMMVSSVVALLVSIIYFGWEDDGTPACTTKPPMSSRILLQDPLVMYIENFLADDDVGKLKEIAYALLFVLQEVYLSILGCSEAD